MNVIEVIDDPNLLAGALPGPTWATWRVFLRSLFALPLSSSDRDVYRHHTERDRPPDQAFREAALVIGRRGGKSRVLALIGVFLAAFRDYAPFIAPGETPVVAILAADRRQARVTMRYCLGFLQHAPLLATMIDRVTDDAIALKNGVVLEVHVSRIASPRGRTFACVIADECAFWWTDFDAANPDVEVLNACRPGLATIPGSLLLIASSPYARRGALWNAFRRHFGKDDAPTLVWKGTTEEMNPSIDPAVIAEKMEEDPIAARAEYFAEFRTDVEAFMSVEALDKCVAIGRIELPYLTEHAFDYQAFVDPSGGSANSFTLAIAHREGDVAVLDAVREAKPPFDPDSVVEDFARLLTAYGVSHVTGDRYGGDWVASRFRDHGVKYEPSEKSKSELYREMLPLVNARRVELLDVRRLHAQLLNLERRTARGGRDSIDHAPNTHDDIANAAAGALVCVLTHSSLAMWAKL